MISNASSSISISVLPPSTNRAIYAVTEVLLFVSAGGFCVGLSLFLLEGKIDGTAPSTRVLRPTPKETLISLAWKWNSQILVVFLISKVSAPPLPLYWPISVLPNFGKGYIFRKFKESNAWLLFMYVVWSTSTPSYAAVYPRATTSNSRKSFKRRIQVGFLVFCNVFHISAGLIY